MVICQSPAGRLDQVASQIQLQQQDPDLDRLFLLWNVINVLLDLRVKLNSVSPQMADRMAILSKPLNDAGPKSLAEVMERPPSGNIRRDIQGEHIYNLTKGV